MDTNHELRQVFDFTDSDLASNRMGELSQRQLTKLRMGANRNFALSMVMILAVGVLALFTIPNTSSEVSIALFTLAIPTFVAFRLTIGAVMRVAAPNTVQKRTGQVYLRVPMKGFAPPLPPEKLAMLATRRGWFDTSYSSLYMMVIEDQVFALDQQKYAVMSPSVYTVYFLPTMHKIMAVEIVAYSDEKAKRIIDVPEGVPLMPLTSGQPSGLFDRHGEDLKG